MAMLPLVEKLVNRVVVSKMFKLKCDLLGNRMFFVGIVCVASNQLVCRVRDTQKKSKKFLTHMKYSVLSLHFINQSIHI